MELRSLVEDGQGEGQGLWNPDSQITENFPFLD